MYAKKARFLLLHTGERRNQYVTDQGIETIGLKEGNIRLSFVLGGTLAAILFFCNCLSNVLFEHQSFIDFADILIYLVYFFTVGLVEEVLFRGCLQTSDYSGAL